MVSASILPGVGMKDASTIPSRMSPNAPRRWTKVQLEMMARAAGILSRCWVWPACRQQASQCSQGMSKSARLGCDDLRERDAGFRPLLLKSDHYDLVL